MCGDDTMVRDSIASHLQANNLLPGGPSLPYYEGAGPGELRRGGHRRGYILCILLNVQQGEEMTSIHGPNHGKMRMLDMMAVTMQIKLKFKIISRTFNSVTFHVQIYLSSPSLNESKYPKYKQKGIIDCKYSTGYCCLIHYI